MSLVHGRGLGRKPPTDDRHLRRFALTAATMPTLPTPVVLGTNWYAAMNDPEQDSQGRYWILRGPQSSWGRIEGGHAYCTRPPRLVDDHGWWTFYDQGRRSACVGFAVSRMMSLLNRRRYSGNHVYDAALKIDEWPGEADEGTSVRAGCEVARVQGMWRVRQDAIKGPIAGDGIEVYRWCGSVEEIAACLDPASGGKRILDLGYLQFVNSWGRFYPHYTCMPLEAVRILCFGQWGDATLVTDR